jgi:hypothetical protein
LSKFHVKSFDFFVFSEESGSDMESEQPGPSKRCVSLVDRREACSSKCRRVFEQMKQELDNLQSRLERHAKKCKATHSVSDSDDK